MRVRDRVQMPCSTELSMIKLPIELYAELCAHSGSVKYRQWIGLLHGGYEYYGRPLPVPCDYVVLPSTISRLKAGAAQDVPELRFLDRLVSLTSITLDRPPTGPVVNVPVCAGCELPGGVLVVATEPCSGGLGLVTLSTVINTVPPRCAPSSPSAPAGTLPRALADVLGALAAGRVACIVGARGSGKSWTAERAASALSCQFRPVTAAEFFEATCNLRSCDRDMLVYVDGAEELCPSRSLCPKGSAGLTNFANRLAEIEFSGSRYCVRLVLGFRETDTVDTFAMSRYMCHAANLTFPDLAGREYILRHICSAIDPNAVAKLTLGYSFADLCRLVTVLRGSSCQEEGIRNTVKRFTASLYSHFKLEVDQRTTWETLGGLRKTRPVIQELVEDPLKYADEFRRNRVAPPRGLLLHGPPGCSKTSIAKAIANSTGLPFYSLTTASIFSSFVGESERCIRELFAAAKMTRPSIIFLDEMEVIVGRRGSGRGDAVQERLLATFLTEMDGAGGGSDGVLLIGATNRASMIDPALLRPGRFDCIVEIGLPDCEDRLDILDKLGVGAGVAEKVAGVTEGLSAAGLKGLVDAVRRMCADPVGSIGFAVFEEAMRIGSDRIESAFPL